jgi:hypothetical protein
LTWENLIEANRPPQLENPTTTQREILPPHIEVETEPVQIIEANRPPQLEQVTTTQREISPPQTEIEVEPVEIIEANRSPQLEQATTTQRLISPPPTEIEAEPTQITEAQTSQTQAVTKRKNITMVSLRSPLGQGREENKSKKQIKQFEMQQSTLKNFKMSWNNLYRKMFKQSSRKIRQHKRRIRETPNL